MAYNDFTSEEKLVLQADVLWEDTSKNPNLPALPLVSKNKALKTENKRVIRAINELNDKINTVSATVDNNIAAFIKVLGDYNANPELIEDLRLIGPDVISVILALNERVKELEKTVGIDTPPVRHYKSEVLTYSPDNLYQLAYGNVDLDNFELTINGVEYQDCDDYIFDEVEGAVLWKSEDISLDETDEIVAQYYISEGKAYQKPGLTPVFRNVRRH